MSAADCIICGDTGWTTVVDDSDGSGYEIACPFGCPAGAEPPDPCHPEVPY